MIAAQEIPKVETKTFNPSTPPVTSPKIVTSAGMLPGYSLLIPDDISPQSDLIRFVPHTGATAAFLLRMDSSLSGLH